MAKHLKSEAAVALALDPVELADLANQYYWTGWKNHHWPADLVRPGLRLYAADLRPNRRQFVALLEVSRGGQFLYSKLGGHCEQRDRSRVPLEYR